MDSKETFVKEIRKALKAHGRGEYTDAFFCHEIENYAHSAHIVISRRDEPPLTHSEKMSFTATLRYMATVAARRQRPHKVVSVEDDGESRVIVRIWFD